jgi:two-component system response regulator YesN
VNSRIFHYPSEWELNIKEALSGHDQNKLKKNVELFVAHCTKQAADPVSVIDACIRFASTILHVAGVMLGDVIITKDQNDIYHRLSLVQTPNELQRALLETADKIADKFAQIPKSHSLVINKSVKIIQDKYSSGITLEELANSFNLTPEYLSSLFQKELGISFTAYIKDIRIKKAKELLMRSQLKAFEVAERVGYSDAKYFSRVFKEVTGLTPGEFQKLHR